MLEDLPRNHFGSILVDPPWRFTNRTGKMAPEHRRLKRYDTLSSWEIMALEVASLAAERAHVYLWTPNAMLPDAIACLTHWGFAYKTNIIWYKVRKDGGPDRRGCGFYLRGVTEMILLGVKGSLRTGPAGRSTPNILISQKREHSRKPEEIYGLIESLSPEPRLELFARGKRREGWTQHGDQLEDG